MNYYINKLLKILIFSVSFCVFPVLVLAQSSTIESVIETKISKMTLNEKVGQLFIVGFSQTSIDNELSGFLSEYKPGSFLLFKRNIISLEQIKNLNASLYRTACGYSKLPPLIAIDQEGGSVSRLPIYPAQPNALSIGQTKSPLLAEEMGYQTGLFLREAGFNMNLAPVLDISDPFLDSFIGPRSFGSDPEIVRDMGLAYSKGLLRSHVVPTAKHFPGTGGLRADPHSQVVKNLSSSDEMKLKDLIPFQGYSELGKNVAIMLSHSIYPSLDGKETPASFSEKISTHILRDDLKFKGLTITDDLQMKGSRQLLRPELAAIKALKAGADLVMLTWSFSDQKKAIAGVREAVKRGDISTEYLNEKLHRILFAKAFVNLYHTVHTQPPTPNSLSSKKYLNLVDKILSRNFITNLNAPKQEGEDLKNRQPTSYQKFCAYSSAQEFLDSFISGGIKNVETYKLKRNSSSKELEDWSEKKQCTTIIFAVNGQSTAKILNSLSENLKNKTVVINLGSPSLIVNEKPYHKIVQLYFNHRNSGKKVADNIAELIK